MFLNAQTENSFQYSPTLLYWSRVSAQRWRASAPSSLPSYRKFRLRSHDIFTCSSGVVWIQAGAPSPHRYFICTQTLSFCHRPLAPEIPSSDNEHLSLGYRPSSFQCLITLGNTSFECTASEFSVESQFATAYLHCHNEDISSKINIPEKLLKRSRRGAKRRTLLCTSSHLRFSFQTWSPVMPVFYLALMLYKNFSCWFLLK